MEETKRRTYTLFSVGVKKKENTLLVAAKLKDLNQSKPFEKLSPFKLFKFANIN